MGSIPGSGGSLGAGNGNPLQCSCWEPGGLQSMGSWRARHDWAHTHTLEPQSVVRLWEFNTIIEQYQRFASCPKNAPYSVFQTRIKSRVTIVFSCHVSLDSFNPGHFSSRLHEYVFVCMCEDVDIREYAGQLAGKLCLLMSSPVILATVMWTTYPLSPVCRQEPQRRKGE